MDQRAKPPGYKGQKVVDLVLARQGDAPTRANFKRWHIATERWQMVLCTDGKVYLEVIGIGGVRAQLRLGDICIEQFSRDIRLMQRNQRELHKLRRGSHLWVAEVHPTLPGWFMVTHNDQRVPFKPVKVGARRNGKSMPTCAACKKTFTAGEMAFDAQQYVHSLSGFSGCRPRICRGCCQPRAKGLVEIEGGKPE